MNNLSNNLSALQSLGFTLPGPGYLFGSIVFGLVGAVAWRVGKKKERPITMWLGVALMFYTFAVSRTWLMYLIGFALCAGMFLDRG